MQQLYKLIEVLEDRDGGERGLPAALGIDRAKLKAVKRLANNYDIRPGSENKHGRIKRARYDRRGTHLRHRKRVRYQRTASGGHRFRRAAPP